MQEYEMIVKETYTYKTKVRATSLSKAKEMIREGNELSKEEINNKLRILKVIKDEEVDYDKRIIRMPIKVDMSTTLEPNDINWDYKYIGFYLDDSNNYKYLIQCTICGTIKQYAVSSLRNWWIYRHANGEYDKPKCRTNKVSTPPKYIIDEILALNY